MKLANLKASLCAQWILFSVSASVCQLKALINNICAERFEPHRRWRPVSKEKLSYAIFPKMGKTHTGNKLLQPSGAGIIEVIEAQTCAVAGAYVTSHPLSNELPQRLGSAGSSFHV